MSDERPAGTVRTTNGKLKRLVQVWVTQSTWKGLSQLAIEKQLPLATYLRQLIFAHVEAEKAAKREQKEVENG